MNLKEAFRYQNFMSRLMENARWSLRAKEHAFETTKKHMKNKADPSSEDFEEVVAVEPFAPDDVVIDFMVWLIGEREKLGKAITEAKARTMDIDSMIAANKFKQVTLNSIKEVLALKPTTRIESGRGYKFNNDGVQQPYYYDIEVTQKELFDRDKAKRLAKLIAADSDTVSSEIDSL